MAKKSSIKKQSMSMERHDYLRIKTLFDKWWGWLVYLTIVYIFIYFTWNFTKGTLIGLKSFGNRFSEMEGAMGFLSIKAYWEFFIFVCFVVARGLMFCADGLVNSWLKSPFSQICYSVNKSGIDEKQADKIITLMTEVNEHFKETFRKFGAMTLSTNLMKFCYSVIMGIAEHHPQILKGLDNSSAGKGFAAIVKQRHFLEVVESLSLLVPLALAFYRVKEVRELLGEIEIAD